MKGGREEGIEGGRERGREGEREGSREGGRRDRGREVGGSEGAGNDVVQHNTVLFLYLGGDYNLEQQLHKNFPRRE